jgi:diaminopimelate decarboxylase
MLKTLRVAHSNNHLFNAFKFLQPLQQAVRISSTKVPAPRTITCDAISHVQASVSTQKASIHNAVQQLAATAVNNEPFFLLDIGDVYRKHEAWNKSLPRVTPFYAVKCNSDPMVLRALAALGTGFDCASLVEMQTMLDFGVDAKAIIYAHPCKPPSHIRFAQEHGVEMMTFDNVDELMKIKSIYPDAKYVLFLMVGC